MENLSKKQEEILKSIKKYIAKNNYPPTVREICKMVNLASPSTVHFHLDTLKEKGYIKKGNGTSRSIELLVDNEYVENKYETLPLLGSVVAGLPEDAEIESDEYIDIPSFLIPKNKKVFTLRVHGDSMINKGIMEGDILIVARQNEANNKDIVVAQNENFETTVKTFYKEKDHIRLVPENDNMDPIIMTNALILGKVVGLYRKI